MAISMDSTEVVNLSRQQKANCTRELTRLSNLQRHFSRQSQLEKYKQTTEIEKYRRRLARLHRLRASVSDINNQRAIRATRSKATDISVSDSDLNSPNIRERNPNTTNISASESDINNLRSFRSTNPYATKSCASSYRKFERNSQRYRSVEKYDLNITLQKTAVDTNTIPSNNSNYNSTVKHMDKGDYFTPSYEVSLPRMCFIKAIEQPVDQQYAKLSQASSQGAELVLKPSYQRPDKQYHTDDGSESVTDRCQYDYQKQELLNIGECKSKPKQFINTSGQHLYEQLPKLVGGEKKKSVKFSEHLDTVFQLSDTYKTSVANIRKRPGIKTFVRMASIAKQFEKR